MPKVGVEPTWDCSRQILSLVRIPISPLRRELKMIKLLGFNVKKQYLTISYFKDVFRKIHVIQKNVAIRYFCMLNFVGCIIAI
jgi:hypothetical protein